MLFDHFEGHFRKRGPKVFISTGVIRFSDHLFPMSQNVVLLKVFDDFEGNFLSRIHFVAFLEPLTQKSAQIFPRDLVFVSWPAHILPPRNLNN